MKNRRGERSLKLVIGIGREKLNSERKVPVTCGGSTAGKGGTRGRRDTQTASDSWGGWAEVWEREGRKLPLLLLCPSRDILQMIIRETSKLASVKQGPAWARTSLPGGKTKKRRKRVFKKKKKIAFVGTWKHCHSSTKKMSREIIFR